MQGLKSTGLGAEPCSTGLGAEPCSPNPRLSSCKYLIFVRQCLILRSSGLGLGGRGREKERVQAAPNRLEPGRRQSINHSLGLSCRNRNEEPCGDPREEEVVGGGGGGGGGGRIIQTNAVKEVQFLISPSCPPSSYFPCTPLPSSHVPPLGQVFVSSM